MLKTLSRTVQPSRKTDFDTMQISRKIDFDTMQPSRTIDFDTMQTSRKMDFDAMQPSRKIDFDAMQPLGRIDFDPTQLLRKTFDTVVQIICGGQMWRGPWGASPTSGHPAACPAITPSKVKALCRHKCTHARMYLSSHARTCECVMYTSSPYA